VFARLCRFACKESVLICGAPQSYVSLCVLMCPYVVNPQPQP